MRIGLVGCVKGKGPMASPAADLYVLPVFVGCRRAAVGQRRTRADLLILSFAERSWSLFRHVLGPHRREEGR